MIKAKLLISGNVLEGASELIERWRQMPDSRIWLDIEGELEPTVRDLLSSMGCDELAINDASRTRHPPKVEEFTNSTFILFRGISSLDENLLLVPQQLGVFVGKNYLITVHQGHSVSVHHFWSLTEKKTAALEESGHLALELLHFASGRYLDAILAFENRLGSLEEMLLSGDGERAMKELVSFRSRLRVLRRIFNYHHRLAEQMLNGVGTHLDRDKDQSDSQHRRRDLYDRCERLYSLCNMYYEMSGDLIEGYISLNSHRLNNTMKVLTIITAIFVPLSFLAGLYGMNFDNMPELHFHYGYFFVLGIMALVATSMLLLFRRIRWI